MPDLVRVTRTLTPADVENGYREGVFPMSGVIPGMITWHRPRRRAVSPLDRFHVSRSLARRMRAGGFQVTSDRDFAGVMRAFRPKRLPCTSLADRLGRRRQARAETRDPPAVARRAASRPRSPRLSQCVRPWCR